MSNWQTRVADVLVTCLEGGTLIKGGVDVPVPAGPKTMYELVKITGFAEPTINFGIAAARDRGDLLIWTGYAYKLAETKDEVKRYKRRRLQPILTGCRRLQRILMSASGKFHDDALEELAFDLGQVADKLERVMNR